MTRICRLSMLSIVGLTIGCSQWEAFSPTRTGTHATYIDRSQDADGIHSRSHIGPYRKWFPPVRDDWGRDAPGDSEIAGFYNEPRDRNGFFGDWMQAAYYFPVEEDERIRDAAERGTLRARLVLIMLRNRLKQPDSLSGVNLQVLVAEENWEAGIHQTKLQIEREDRNETEHRPLATSSLPGFFGDPPVVLMNRWQDFQVKDAPDVTEIVRAWALGERDNHGFVISPAFGHVFDWNHSKFAGEILALLQVTGLDEP